MLRIQPQTNVKGDAHEHKAWLKGLPDGQKPPAVRKASISPPCLPSKATS